MVDVCCMVSSCLLVYENAPANVAARCIYLSLAHTRVQRAPLIFLFKIGVNLFFHFFSAQTKDCNFQMLLKACGYDKTFIDNIQYPSKANYQYEHNSQMKFTI